MGVGKDLVFEILAIDGASHVFHKIGTSAEESAAKVDASSGAFGKFQKTSVMAMAGAAAGAALLGAKMIHMAGDFNAGLNTLVTSAGESEKNLGLVGAGIKQIAVATGTSTQQLTAGMYMIESAGHHGADGLKVLRAAAQGAKAENADLSVVTDALTTEMKDFHIPVGRSTQAMNALIATTAAGKTHLQDLAASMSTVAPTAASLGIGMNQVGGAMATMTAQGISADNAAMELRASMLNLVNPNKVAQKEMLSLGLTSKEVGNTLTHQGLGPALEMITQAAGKRFPVGSAAYMQAVARMMGTTRGLQVALALTGKNASQLEHNTRSVGQALANGGKNVEGWDVIQKSFNNRLAQFHQALDVAGISIGQKLLPAASALVGVFSHAVGAIGPMVGWLGKHREVAIGLGVAIGAALVPAVWGLVTATWASVAGFIAANAATGGIVLAIGLLVTGILYAYNHFKWFHDAVNATFQGIKIAAVWLWNNALRPVFEAIKFYIMDILVPYYTFWWHVAEAAFRGIAAVASWLWNNVLGPYFKILGWEISNIIIPYFKFLWTVISTIFEAAGKIIGFFVLTAVALFKFLWTHIWNDYGAPLWHLFSVTIPNMLQMGWHLLNQYFLTPWRQGFNQLYQWIWTDFGQKIYNFFVQRLPGWFREGVQGVKHAFASFASAVLVPVNWVNRYVWNDGVEKVWNSAAGVFGGPKLSPVPMIGAPAFAAGGALAAAATTGRVNRPVAIVGEGNPAWPEYVIPTDPRHRGRARSLWAAAGGELQMMAGGGILGDIWGGLKAVGGALKSLALGGLRAAANSAFDAVNGLLGHIPGAGTEMGQMLISGVKTGERDILSFLGKKDATAIPHGAATSAQVLAWITQAMGLTGVSGPAWTNGLEIIIHYESGGNPRAINLTDSNAAAGDPSRGLMQTIMSTFTAYHQPGTSYDIYDPIANICAGINYINSRYGGINNVPGIRNLAHGGSYVGYAHGGVIPVGAVGLVGEHGPELVGGGRAGVSVAPISRGSDGAFHAVIDLRIDGQVIDRQLVRFQQTGGTMQSAQTEVRRLYPVQGRLGP